MSKKEEFLAEIKSKGLSSPIGIHWGRLIEILKKYAKNDEGDRIPSPLILGGSIASHVHKHERLSEQLDWADNHGCLEEAIAYLKVLPKEKWNISTGNDWNEEHPWVTDGDIS